MAGTIREVCFVCREVLNDAVLRLDHRSLTEAPQKPHSSLRAKGPTIVIWPKGLTIAI